MLTVSHCILVEFLNMLLESIQPSQEMWRDVKSVLFLELFQVFFFQFSTTAKHHRRGATKTSNGDRCDGVTDSDQRCGWIAGCSWISTVRHLVAPFQVVPWWSLAPPSPGLQLHIKHEVYKISLRAAWKKEEWHSTHVRPDERSP